MFWGLDIYQIIAIDEDLDGSPDKFKLRLQVAIQTTSGMPLPDLDGDGIGDAGLTVWLDNDMSGTFTAYDITGGPGVRTSATTYPTLTDGIKQGDFIFKPGLVSTDGLALTQVGQDSLTAPFTGDGAGYLDAIPGSGSLADSVNSNGFPTSFGNRDIFLAFDFRPHPDLGLPNYGWSLNSEDPVIGIIKTEEAKECRMTGGGVDTNGEIILGTMADAIDGKDRYQFGGQVGAPTASQPQPWGEWTHHQQKGPSGSFIFHAGTASAPPGTEILWVACSDPGYCNPARPAPFKQIDFKGVGTFKNIKGPLSSSVIPEGNKKQPPSFHYFRVHVEDIGEPGPGGKQPKSPMCTHVPGTPINESQDCQNCPDVYQIEIHATSDPSSPVIYTVGGFIDAGNLQIHPAIK
jgi:hypothetical protein